jgi:hypothetical protein
VAMDDAGLGPVPDLDDPRELLRRGLRPSRVATLDRFVTQGMALDLFGGGVPGFRWWSTLEASWTNATLFAERAIPALAVQGEPEPLSLDHPALRAAVDALGIRVG